MLEKSQCWLCVICYELFVVNNFCIQGLVDYSQNIFCCGFYNAANNLFYFSLYTGCIMGDCRGGLEFNIQMFERRQQL